MDNDLDENSNPIIENSGGQYEIVDVDDGVGNVEQIIVTNVEDDEEIFGSLSLAQERAADEIVRRKYGNYKPLFNGVIVLGPQFGKLVFVLFCFATISGILGFLRLSIEKEFSVGSFWLGQGLVLISVVFLLWTSLSDPGVIPKDFNLNQYLFELRRSEDCGKPLAVTRPRWCRKCVAPRPPRCYHCIRCDVCIRRQDMHLYIAGLCIGSRNFRQYLSFNVASSALSIYLIVVGVSLVIKSIENSSGSSFFLRSDFNGPCLLLFMGGVLLSFPQTGIIMFIYRMYLVSKNRTVREEYRAYLRKDDSNPFQNSLLLNFQEFIFKSNEPSFFRKKKNQVSQEQFGSNRRWRIANFNRRSDSETLFFPPENFPLHLGINRNFNHGSTEPQSYVENENMRQRLNSQAKVKSHKSLPLLEKGELPKIPGTRFKKSLYSKPLALIKQQIKHYQMSQALPKPMISLKKFKSGKNQSLSESSLPQTAPQDTNLILHQARANQIQQIISCVLRRDRRNLVELARRINVPGLIGMDPDNFDPDDIQMIELNNGLPILTARTRRVNPVPTANQNIVQNVNPVPPPRPNQVTHLPLPQLVAAGLMPTIRQQADSARQQQQAAASLALHSNSNSLRGQTLNNVFLIPPILNRNDNNNNYARRRLSIRVNEAANAVAQIGVNDNSNNNNNLVNLTPMTIPIQSRYYTTRSSIPSSTSRSRSRTRAGTGRNNNNNNNNDNNLNPIAIVLVNQQHQSTDYETDSNTNRS